MMTEVGLMDFARGPGIRSAAVFDPSSSSDKRTSEQSSRVTPRVSLAPKGPALQSDQSSGNEKRHPDSHFFFG
jgi:hypothetical protein